MIGILADELEVLANRFQEEGIPLILAGGMGLYLRDRYFDPEGRSPNYPVRPQSRTTEDLDLVLNAPVIVDPEQTRAIREILDDLGYEPSTQHFIFERTEPGEPERTLEVDLLGVPPSESRRDDVKIGERRIRPLGYRRLHGRYTEEGEGIDYGKIEIELSEVDSEKSGRVYIPSALNYAVLKLHAFDERLERNHDRSARRHAFDIFRIVTDMRPTDWERAEAHVRDAPNADYLASSKQLRSTHFEESSDPGFQHLRRHENFAVRSDEFDSYLDDFRRDLSDLLAGGF